MQQPLQQQMQVVLIVLEFADSLCSSVLGSRKVADRSVVWVRNNLTLSVNSIMYYSKSVILPYSPFCHPLFLRCTYNFSPVANSRQKDHPCWPFILFQPQVNISSIMMIPLRELLKFLKKVHLGGGEVFLQEFGFLRMYWQFSWLLSRDDSLVEMRLSFSKQNMKQYGKVFFHLTSISLVLQSHLLTLKASHVILCVLTFSLRGWITLHLIHCPISLQT